MSQFTELEELEAFCCHTQDLLAFESENTRKDFISKYFGDESDQRTRFEKPTTVNEIEQRERERIPLKTRQSTSLSVNPYQACFGYVFYFYFFVDVAKWQLLHHPIMLCETERYILVYANLHTCFL